ncbi:transcription antitermination factor NusB [Lederbergia graminis]|uniref:Transcription antitermination protein NusB n=1 Tax=Lederbergia graminis TaxID=735518 RepID=A0ABW0LEB4_9BACI
MKRRVAREKALQALYQIDMSGADPAEALEYVLEEEESDIFLKTLIEGTMENRNEIDEEIEKHLEKWTLSRLAKVDLNILRIGVYELKYLKDAPSNVVLNEAIEIAKRFGDEKSSKFINGILSKVKDNL